MTDGDAILRTILERPEDDTPRLVLADWLEENGEPERGEFCRVQVELARLGSKEGGQHGEDGHRECPGCCQVRALRRREGALLGEYWCEWVGLGDDALCELNKNAALYCSNLHSDHSPRDRDVVFSFRRGFVESVSCSLATLFGGPCRRCYSPGWGRSHGTVVTAGPTLSTCPDCHGTGHTPGVAAALWAGHPVTRVTLTDREPVELPGGWWWGCTNGRRFARDAAPDELLNDYFEFGPHPSREAAVAYLSGRVVAWERSLAVSSPRH